LGGALGIGRRSNAADAPGTHPAAPTPVAYCGDPGWGDGLSQQQCQPMDSNVAQAASPPSSYMAKPKQ
jgi:hypothetical protein